MWKLLTSLTALGMAFAALLAPAVAQGQQAESEHMFNRRMDARLDRVIMDCRRLRKDFTPVDEEGERRRSRHDPNSGVLKQLDTIEEAAREQQRELDSFTGMSSRTDYDLYLYQQRIQYNVRALEQNVRYIGEMARETAAREAGQNAAAGEAPGDGAGDGVSDEDWAEEWARGDR